MTPTWWLVSDIDGTLTGDSAGLAALRGWLADQAGRVGFGVASGRSPELIAEAVREFGLPEPQLSIASVGSEIITSDPGFPDWPGPLLDSWRPDELRAVLAQVDGIEPQPPAGQGQHKLGYWGPAEAADRARLAVAAAGLEANLLHSAGRFLDVLPAGVSKGSAVRFVARWLDVPLSRIVVAGDTGNDRELLLCGARAVMVANHTEELAELKHADAVYTASQPHALGVLEGLRHYGVGG